MSNANIESALCPDIRASNWQCSFSPTQTTSHITREEHIFQDAQTAMAESMSACNLQMKKHDLLIEQARLLHELAMAEHDLIIAKQNQSEEQAELSRAKKEFEEAKQSYEAPGTTNLNLLRIKVRNERLLNEAKERQRNADADTSKKERAVELAKSSLREIERQIGGLESRRTPEEFTQSTNSPEPSILIEELSDGDSTTAVSSNEAVLDTSIQNGNRSEGNGENQTSCWGCVWRWIVDYICDPIAALFAKVFSWRIPKQSKNNSEDNPLNLGEVCIESAMHSPIIINPILPLIGEDTPPTPVTSVRNAPDLSIPLIDPGKPGNEESLYADWQEIDAALPEPAVALSSVEYLNAPSQISSPLESPESIVWPEGTKIPYCVQQLLEYFVCSNEGRALLRTSTEESAVAELFVASTDLSPSQRKRLLARQNCTILQNHLSAVVESLRNPDPTHPLNKNHLNFHVLFKQVYEINIQNSRVSAFDLFFCICAVLNAGQFIDSFSLEDSFLVNSVLGGPFLPKQKVMEPANYVSTESLPMINPEQPKSQKYLNDLLLLLALSEKSDSWLQKEVAEEEPVYLTDDSDLWIAIRSLEKRVEYITRVKLQDQLAGIINKLRAQKENDPVTVEHLKVLNRLIKVCGLDPNPSVTDYLKLLCRSFQGKHTEFRDLHRAYLEAVNCFYPFLSVEKPNTLAPAKKIALLDLPSTNSFNNQHQAIVCKVLCCIAESADWDPYLTDTLKARRVDRASFKSNSDYEIALMTAVADHGNRVWLQKQLCGMIHLLRSQPPSIDDEAGQASTFLSVEHVDKFMFLLETGGCHYQSEADLIEFLQQMLDMKKPSRSNTPASESWEEIKKRVLVDEVALPAACELTISRPLTNLSATCYVNSVLQMMAKLSCFDELLTHEITFQPPVQQTGESQDHYQTRVRSLQEEFDKKVDKRKALQSHLRVIIRMMRFPETNEPIPYADLSTLFKLMQINGWTKPPSTEQDPHDLLTFLRDVLDSKVSEVHTVLKYSYTKEGRIIEEQGRADPIPDLQMALPIDSEGSLLPEFDSTKKLIDHHFFDELIGEEAWCPTNESVKYDTEKRSYVVHPSPNTLFVQLKRFGFKIDKKHPDGGSPFRISCSIPVDPVIRIPVYNPTNLDETPKEESYRLKAVIGHSGGVSVNTGHYTTWTLQKCRDEATGEFKDTWVYYSDALIKEFPSEPECPKELMDDILLKGYYLAYERDS